MNATGSGSSAADQGSGPFYRPYEQSDADFIYNLLFCDDPELFRSDPGVKPSGSMAVLFSKKPSLEEVREIANDETAESRIRLLAYNYLRSQRAAVPARKLLGVVVELPLGGGLDVIAAFEDGRMRYINHTGKMAIFEAMASTTEAQRKALMNASRAAIGTMGPWDRPRLPPPRGGNARLTFLVSDGLYFGEGPASGLQHDSKGGPIVKSAIELLKAIVSTVTSSPTAPSPAGPAPR